MKPMSHEIRKSYNFNQINFLNSPFKMQTLHCTANAIATIAPKTAENIYYIIVYFTISFHTILHSAHRHCWMNRYRIPQTITHKYQNANRK